MKKNVMNNNKDKKLLFVLGTRPEKIKLLPLINKWDNSVDLNTGQHDDKLLDMVDLKADYTFTALKYKTIPNQLSYMIENIDKAIRFEKPEAVVVQGDTTSALSGALAAYYNKVKVIHVEAGLRTYNKNEPFPEETNRILIDNISSILFAPTFNDYRNLRNELISKDNIYIVGNTVVDNLNIVLADMDDVEPIDQILITLHRRENADEPVRENIFTAIKILAEMFPHFNFVYPVHPSYRYPYKSFEHIKNIKLIEPLTYVEFIREMKRSYLVMSDSGGIQEEAPTLHKPVIVLRNYTERINLITHKGGFLVGSDMKKIVKRTSNLITNKELYKNMTSIANPFGDGKTSDRIVNILRSIL